MLAFHTLHQFAHGRTIGHITDERNDGATFGRSLLRKIGEFITTARDGNNLETASGQLKSDFRTNAGRGAGD
jgi:hypothetical protein